MAETQFPEGVDSRGYLKGPYRLFHLNCMEKDPIQHHYHTFHKLLLFLSGSLSYRIEGCSYTLRSGDLLLVPAYTIHEPIIGPNIPYERILLWINPNTLAGPGLDPCFAQCQAEHSYLLPRERYDSERMLSLLTQLETSERGEAFGDESLSQSLVIQIMVFLNRCMLTPGEGLPDNTYSDPRINEVLSYIEDNLDGDLSVNALCAQIFMSRSWLMHRFKELTGYTLHQYVVERRMIQAARLLRGDVPVGETARRCGYTTYTTFLRTFEKNLGHSPREF